MHSEKQRKTELTADKKWKWRNSNDNKNGKRNNNNDIRSGIRMSACICGCVLYTQMQRHRVQQKHDIYSQTTKFRSDSGEHTTFYEWYHWNIINNNNSNSNHMNRHVNRCHGWELSKYDGIWCDGEMVTCSFPLQQWLGMEQKRCTKFVPRTHRYMCVRAFKYILSLCMCADIRWFFFPFHLENIYYVRFGINFQYFTSLFLFSHGLCWDTYLNVR